MKLIKKANLSFIDGMLIENKTNKVVYLQDLKDEVNEIIDLIELIDFVGAHVLEISTAAENKKIEFTPTKVEKPQLKSGLIEPVTPLADTAMDEAKAIAEEFLNVQQYGDINAHLKRYPVIAAFLAKDYVLVEDDYKHSAFKFNVLELTEGMVVDAVIAYHDPEIRKLIAGVVITR